MNRVLSFGGLLAALGLMFLPATTHVLGMPVPCGNGWQALLATGDAGLACNSVGQSRGLVALAIGVGCVVLAYFVKRRQRETDLRCDMAAALPKVQRIAYESARSDRLARKERAARIRLTVVGVLMLLMIAAVLVGSLLS